MDELTTIRNRDLYYSTRAAITGKGNVIVLIDPLAGTVTYLLYRKFKTKKSAINEVDRLNRAIGWC